MCGRSRLRRSGRASGEAREHELAALARRQNGVLSRGQLRAGGLSRDSVDYAVRIGRLAVVHRGVYLLGGAPLTVAAREFAALLACAPSAALSHRSAAYRLGLLPYPAGYEEVEVSVTRRGPAGKPGIQVHRVASLVRGEIHVRDGLRLTTGRRTLLDLAAAGAGRELEQALAVAEATGRVNPDSLIAYLDNHRHRKGVGVLRRLLEAEPTLTRSDAEERLLSLIRGSSLPTPRLNARVARFEVDFLWEPERLVVEVDGYRWHGSRAASDRDKARDAELAALGIRVIRVSWGQLVAEPDRVLARIGGALRAPAARGCRRP